MFTTFITRLDIMLILLLPCARKRAAPALYRPCLLYTSHIMTSRAMAEASGERLNHDSAQRSAKKKPDRFMTHAPQ